MAANDWTDQNALVRLLQERAHDFEYFQMLHLIERRNPSAAMIGHAGPARDEPVRLRPSLKLGFPPGDIESATWRDGPDGTGKLLITSTFLGLYGTNSPLATHFTESLMPEREGDIRVRDFIDLFHHRVYSLLYRVWKKYRYHATFRVDGQDAISQIVRGVLGLGTPHLTDGLRLNSVRLFRYAGLLSQRPRSGTGLMGQLRDFFEGITFGMEECTGRWLWIQPNDRNVLGQAKCSLGENCLLGDRLFDRSGKFRIKTGPVTFADYVRFMPPGDASAQLSELIRFYCVDPLDFDNCVTLCGNEVPQTPLGERGETGMLARLGWTTWLKSEPSEDKSVVIQPPRLEPETEDKEQTTVPEAVVAAAPAEPELAAQPESDDIWG